MPELLWYLLGSVAVEEGLRLVRWLLVLRLGPGAVTQVMRVVQESQHGS